MALTRLHPVTRVVQQRVAALGYDVTLDYRQGLWVVLAIHRATGAAHLIRTDDELDAMRELARVALADVRDLAELGPLD